MADQPIVHIGENSPEEVAFKLLEKIAAVEKKLLHGNPVTGWQNADRKYILTTYAEALLAVRAPEDLE